MVSIAKFRWQPMGFIDGTCQNPVFIKIMILHVCLLVSLYIYFCYIHVTVSCMFSYCVIWT